MSDHHDPIGGAHPTGPEANLEDEYQILDPGTTATNAPTSGSAPAGSGTEDTGETARASTDPR